jgi:hypothetical protein
MNHENTIDRDMTHRLERLACGELDEAARQPLVDWLERDPRRWRLCGLAFLEAQSWSTALGEVGEIDLRGSTIRDKMPTQLRPRRFSMARSAMLAVSLAIAFALGWSIRPQSSLAVSSGDSQIAGVPASDAVLATFSVQGAASPATVQIPVVPGDSEMSSADSLDRIPEYIRQQWERRGYRLTSERRYLFAKLPSGQQVVVPIDRLVANPLPTTVY